jgi:hypothetical protein
VRTSTENDRQPDDEEEESFCLADTLTDLSDEELARMAEEHAEADVSSSALEGIPLDKERLKAGLLASYQRMRAERAAQR